VASNVPISNKLIIRLTVLAKGCTTSEIEEHGMFSCTTGRCVHNTLVCQDLNPCGDFTDCGGSGFPLGAADGNGADDKAAKSPSFVVITLIVVGVVFGLFALIQIILVLKHQQQKCGWQRNRDTLEGQVVSIDFNL